MKKITEKQNKTFTEHLVRNVARRVIPLAFDAAKMPEQAAKLRAIDENASMAELSLVCRDTADATSAAYASATSAAYAAAASAAYTSAAAAYAADTRAYAASAAAAYATRAPRTAAADTQEYTACLLDAADSAGLVIPARLNLATLTLETVVAENRFSMCKWHERPGPENWCNTTHCQAGAAIAICKDDGGWELEKAFGPATAGALIYAASDREAGRVPQIPNFEATDEDGLADLHRRALLEYI